LLDNIGRIVDPRQIDLVISNHTEMDHSGGLARVMHRIGEEKPLYCSQMGLKNLARHFTNPWQYHAVKNGETLDLGQRTLTFMETRMLHWPDSMFTYLPEDKILFSSDAFGQHYAGPQVFDDELGVAVMGHAKKYFANILLLFAPRILKLIAQIEALGLKIDLLCPDHGLLWRRPGDIIAAYGRWSRPKTKDKAVLFYDTMWHSTERMAAAITAGLTDTGIAVRPMSLKKWHRSDIMTDVVDARAIIVGSPTLNNGLFPTVSDMLSYLKGLKPKNKLAAAFGSYGWSGEAVRLINQEFAAMKLEPVDDGLRLPFVPDSEGLATCYAYGQKIAAAMLATE
jgi:flavorubredoxin